MKIAVTGVTGFMGTHVLKELVSRKSEVIAVTRFLPGDLPNIPKVQYVQLDIMCPPSNPFDYLGKPDVLIHLAWGGLPNYQSLHHFEEELPGHYRFLKKLVEFGLSNLLVVGTCFEYGMQSGPLSEEMESNPSNPYGLAKDMLRRQLVFLKGIHPFNVTWARLFYLYGDGQAENSLFPQLRRAVERGEKNFNMSGGEQLRDYLPATETARYIVALGSGGRDNGVVNICSGRPISIRKLVENWIRENNWTIKLNFGHYSYPDFEPMAFWGDRKKLDHCMHKL